MKYAGYNTGEMAELAEGARLLSECTVKSRTEGSNPSLSATEKKGPMLIWHRPFWLSRQHPSEIDDSFHGSSFVITSFVSFSYRSSPCTVKPTLVYLF